MRVVRWSSPAREVAERIGVRLRSGTRGTPRAVIWERDGRRLVLHLSTLAVELRDGWLLVDLLVQAGETGRQRLQFVFYLGEDGDGDGARAGGTIHTTRVDATRIADFWGEGLQRVVWDGVLDVIEGSVELSEERARGAPVSLLGFSSTDGFLHVDTTADDG